jgi:tRNA A37 threonylcarbamoyladenosine dehydratase
MGLYDRQESLKLMIPESICVVGCGGVGYWVAKFAAMSGIEKIYLFDPDVIEEHNLNRLDLTNDYIGRNKAEVAKEIIVAIRPYISVYIMPFILQEHTFPKTTWLIDCTDKIKSQMENQRIAKKFGSIYVKAGYNGESVTISDSVAEWGEADDGYTIIPSWVVPASTVAALTVAKIMKYKNGEISKTIKQILS